MYETLKRVPLFAGLNAEDLAELCRDSEEVQLAAGSELFAEGTAGDRAYVITEGEMEIVKASSGRDLLLAVRRPGEVIGEMGLFEETPRMAAARARTDVTLLSIPKPALDGLLDTSATAAKAMFHTILNRWRSTEGQLRQSERMAQLGTLTAGVVHELNNPAAGVQRAADQLHAAVGSYGGAQARLQALVSDSTTLNRVAELLERVHELEGRPDDLDPLARSDQESELETWLEGHGVAEPWTVAKDLVSLHLDSADLESLEADGDDQLAAIVAAVSATYQVHNLLSEIERGVSRLSEIVKALKSYSYLDQAPVQDVDVRVGLDETLLLMRSKLDGLRITRDYDEDLPLIEASGSELNQVWLNLVDNAADALHASGRADGEITLRAFAEADGVIVEITDNGPGIPVEIQERIFDSFFTTKPPGKGTGLGLDISYSIVVTKHRGDITFDSEPGNTAFRVELPRHR